MFHVKHFDFCKNKISRLINTLHKQSTLNERQFLIRIATIGV